MNFKWRTALAVLGVFFGTFSLIVVSNLAGSLAMKTEQELENLGINLLVVRSGIVHRVGPMARLFSEATTLTLADAKAILDHGIAVKDVSPSGLTSFPVRYESTVLKAVLVTGATPNFQEVRNFHVREGSFFTEEDNQKFRKVAVLGKTVADKLFGIENPIGKSILVWRVPCRVVGLMEDKGVDISGVDQDNQIFVPLHTYLKSFVNKDNVNVIYVQGIDGESLPRVKADIEILLRERHKIKEGQSDDFGVIDLKDVTAMKAQAMDLITMLGRIAATASFTIGGLGILSIMILIVNERKLEIGIRRAVGSRKRDIILQFLLESSFISLVGGMVGVAAGFLASFVIFNALKYPVSISIAGLALAFAASVTVGILAGIYPSKKAIAIQPVDIIRQ
ncbi:MAG: ABC transporter permease [Deltaproteobacteria bacterium]|nr:ABC transporter permease [Deltaproteobacteria bacterium]